MSVTPSPIGGFAAQFFDNNGVILSGGKIYTYAAGTTTPQATYTSASGVTPHANPIILDSAGRVPGGEIWLTDGLVYKFVIETATSILLGTYDNITGVNSNFVNYTVQEEVITATAGQTVFNLSTINYTPGTNSLTVYIDGVNQYVGDSYLETDSDTVTFTAGLHVGAEVKFTTAVQSTSGAVDASIVSYNPAATSLLDGVAATAQEALDDLSHEETGSQYVGFIANGTGAEGRTAEAKMRDVVSLKDFGAVGDGVVDDTVAVQAAIDAAFATGTKITIDGNDGSYLLSDPIVYPAGSLVTLCNAKFLADATFDTSSYMLEVTSQDAGICNTDLVFDNLYFDAAHTGGCMVIDNYLRIVVNDCTFCHFSTDGLKLLKTIDSHECLVSKCFSFEYFYGEPGYLTPTATSVGFNIVSFDNSFTDVVCYYTGNGMVVDAQYNLIAQAHLGGSVNALHITDAAAYSSFSQIYIDSGRVLWEDPWNTEFVGCKFLHNTSDTNFKFIVLKPLSAGRALKGVKIVDCSFHNINAATLTAVSVDTSAGTFDVSLVAQCYIENNSFVNVTPAFTKVRTSLFQTAATVWSFDLSTYFPFGNVQKAFCTYYAATTPTAVANITSISGNTVTVTASAAGNGTIYLDADVNVGVS